MTALAEFYPNVKDFTAALNLLVGEGIEYSPLPIYQILTLL